MLAVTRVTLFMSVLLVICPGRYLSFPYVCAWLYVHKEDIFSIQLRN